MHKAQQAHHDIITSNIGLITHRCRKHYLKLPARAQVYFDVDDMVQATIAHIALVAHKFDSSKAKSSTWIWMVTDNYCKALITHYRSQRYMAAYEVSLDIDEIPDTAKPPQDVYESREQIEGLIRMASPVTRDFIEFLFKRSMTADSVRKPSQDVMWELRSLVKMLGVHYDDFTAVLSTIQCR